MGARSRVESIDVLRGFVMVIMALDHVRGVWGPPFDPTDLEKTSPGWFATRWITHLCAPTFVLLAGTGAGMSTKPKGELAKFLVTRGLWLIVLEVTIVRFGFDSWTFWRWTHSAGGVIWVIGWSMILLAAIIYLPRKAIIAFGLVLVIGHNALDGISTHWAWKLVHVKGEIGDADVGFYVQYPLVPWVGVMALGYALGEYLARAEVDRAKLFARAGIAMLVAFIALRSINVYGDLVAWSVQDTRAKSVMSFLNVTKYPPSLDFLCATLGLSTLFAAAVERVRTPFYELFHVFGRVPLFYYVLHLIPITQIADVFFRVREGAWPSMQNVTDGNWYFTAPVVFGFWIVLVAALYPLCKWFAGVKARRRDWWLGYL